MIRPRQAAMPGSYFFGCALMLWIRDFGKQKSKSIAWVDEILTILDNLIMLIRMYPKKDFRRKCK